ncbi:hypothetical protein SPRG_14233 [Saprolegnia parasitica CBS 223.65]|uniref:START domain-containing protein n=1 Tax=Saprolegnia parasitica (strain CBS 223.65) TaxID=695850 RepID=A0A067BZJ2_SAPPC|nr:hypothetical protein SPRG_14233 [Saprolegnia parasitica CBS 223.65]KDO19706.1 hypothetical protein SPRG_14233 [Saprolegnia parasitica CBS 223.65]|eukprot:XP_012209566.1 hypothetical protein SPRG_14233 [Saprolegnia parasitica CBS 223.65]
MDLSARKRLRDRRAKQAARVRFLAEYNALTDAAAAMRRTLRGLQSGHRPRSCLLPWEEIMKALADATRDSIMTNRTLAAHVADHGHRVELLRAWVVLGTSTLVTWPRVRLPAAPRTVRALALEWLAERMRHATAYMVSEARFPTPARTWVHTTQDVHGRITAFQHVVAGSLDDAVAATWTTLVSIGPRTIVSTCKNSTTEVTYSMQQARTPQRDVHACFVQESKTTLVHCTLHDCDEKNAASASPYIQEWIVLTCLSSTHCVVQSVQLSRPATRHASMLAFASLEHPDVLPTLRRGRSEHLEAELQQRLGVKATTAAQERYLRIESLLCEAQAQRCRLLRPCADP